MNKLETLESLERFMGCELIKLFTAFHSGAYVVTERGIIHTNINHLFKNLNGKYVISWNKAGFSQTNTYGTDWALTREELFYEAKKNN